MSVSCQPEQLSEGLEGQTRGGQGKPDPTQADENKIGSNAAHVEDFTQSRPPLNQGRNLRAGKAAPAVVDE